MQSDRNTQLVIVIGFLVLHLLFKSPYFLYIALGVGLLSILSKTLGAWIVAGWYGLAKVLGWINARVLLSIVFFLLLTPMAFLSKLFGSNPIPKFTGKEDSHFIVRDYQFGKKDVEEMW